jgi:hypothetical protein
MVLEVALIGPGVFLGLAGEQWRQERSDRQEAAEALRRFRAEIVANREAVGAVKDYHAQKLKELDTFFEATPDVRASMKVSFQGLEPGLISAYDELLKAIDGELAQ